MKQKIRMTEDKKRDMFQMFEEKFKNREVAELIGCSEATVYDYKKEWRRLKALGEVPEVSKETETEQEVPEGLEHSDYAKAYLKNDPAVVHSSFEIQRNVRIRSNKTGILYEMDVSSGDRKMAITLADGQKLEIELGMFERFVDEGVDVYLEMKRGA